MSDLTLQIKDEDEICLPDWIGSSSLSLTEIGAVACLACLETQGGGHMELLSKRLTSLEFKAVLTSLQKKGVLKSSLNGNHLSMELDLDVVAPE